VGSVPVAPAGRDRQGPPVDCSCWAVETARDSPHAEGPGSSTYHSSCRDHSLQRGHCVSAHFRPQAGHTPRVSNVFQLWRQVQAQRSCRPGSQAQRGHRMRGPRPRSPVESSGSDVRTGSGSPLSRSRTLPDAPSISSSGASRRAGAAVLRRLHGVHDVLEPVELHNAARFHADALRDMPRGHVHRPDERDHPPVPPRLR